MARPVLAQPSDLDAGYGPPSRTRPTKYCIPRAALGEATLAESHHDATARQRAVQHPLAFGRIGKRQLDSSSERRRGSMKINILVGSVVMGLALCTQSFGFELLDQMLGIKSGCCEATSCCEAPKCCTQAEPTCAAAVAPSCGCEAAAPSCGCEAAPSCCKSKCCRKPIFNFNRCCKPKCCKSACDSCAAAAPSCGCEAAAAPSCGCEAAAAPSCGCEAAPSCGCAKKCCKSRCGGCLLDRIFACNKRCCKPKCCHNACDTCAAAAPSCGCEGGHGVAPAPAVEGGDAPPMPPAPVVDPSAFVPSQRRVVHASTGSLR